MNAPSPHSFNGFRDGDGRAFSEAIMSYVNQLAQSGGEIREELQRLSQEATDHFLDPKIDHDGRARYGLAALVAASTLAGIASFARKNGDISDSECFAIMLQERAAGNALQSSLENVSPQLRATIEGSFLSRWSRSFVAQDETLGDAVKGLGRSAIESSQGSSSGSGCMVLLFGLLLGCCLPT